MFLSTNSIKYMARDLNWTQQLIPEDVISLVGFYYNLPINEVKFKVQQIDDETYQIHVIFNEERRTLTFSKIHTNNCNLDINNHIDVDDYIHFVSDLSKTGANVMDLWPLNGIIKRKQFLKNTLKGELKYLEDLSKLLKFKKKHKDLTERSLKVMVLDLKNKTTNYRSKYGILEHEKEIAAFFHPNNKIKKRAKKQSAIYSSVRAFDIDYIFQEGSLKHDLLYDCNLFNGQEIAYFDSSEGGKDLCQLCELIMNGFKTLYQVEIGDHKSYIFHPRDYIIHIPSLTNKRDSMKVTKLQNLESSLDDIGLITYYPHCYLSVYSKDKPYYKCISKFDGVQLKHDVFDDFSNITCIQIEKQHPVQN
eukprot:35765_1